MTTLGAATIASTSYPVYDGNSNLKHAVVNSRTIDYIYDAQNQLVMANTTSHASYERFTYDASGNRLTMTTPSGIANYTYDSDNRLVHAYGAMANTVYVYDGDGNLTQKVTPDAVIQFTYNAANRLVGWTNGTSVVSFEYDGDGNRVSKTVDGEKTRYVNDVAGPVSQVMMELDDTYHVTAKYFYGGERLMQYRGAMAYYVYDAPGRSVVAMINTPSSVTNSYAYGAFGGITNATEPIYNDYLYDGEQYDEETGLIYLRNRYYDPEIGRFISKDPYPGELVNPITINPYPFVGNNPVNYIDPLGLTDIYGVVNLNLVYGGIMGRKKYDGGPVINFGVFIDTNNLGKGSGVFYSKGTGEGLEIGYSGGFGIAPRGLKGSATNTDLDIIYFSLSKAKDDKENNNGGSFTGGYSIGVAETQTDTQTYTFGDAATDLNALYEESKKFINGLLDGTIGFGCPSGGSN